VTFPSDWQKAWCRKSECAYSRGPVQCDLCRMWRSALERPLGFFVPFNGTHSERGLMFGGWWVCGFCVAHIMSVFAPSPERGAA